MSKPQLTTYSKALLLMHRSNFVCNRPKDDTMSAFEFYKYLLISRDFLRASQLYRVYQFAIFEYCSDDKKFDVSATKILGFPYRTTRFKLTLDEIRTWNRLLNVQYVKLATYNHEYAEEFMAVSRIFTGHIALNLFCDDNAKYHSDIIRQIQKQLYYLICHAKLLIGSSDMPQLDSIDCTLYIDNLGQFKQVMARHRFKEILTANLYKYDQQFDEEIDDNFCDNFPTCPSVKKLRFVWTNLSEDNDFISKLTQMRPFFPNLVELMSIRKFHPCTPREFGFQELVAWIREECKKIDELQNAWLSIPHIEIFYDFKIRKPESIEVANQLGFKLLETTKFNKVIYAQIIVKPKDNENDVPNTHCYAMEVHRIQANCCAVLRFTVDAKPLPSNNDNE
ncbi:hypothetical protein M3Y94_00785500 [Aphelenchoides besseyi]|nr:hypothetical protein M3Y94_00785500 [Aphelenchoides besseyi]KAI6232393.1 hypothetical protein M3Y95_00481300 [Aphelenchoides besseyi]